MVLFPRVNNGNNGNCDGDYDVVSFNNRDNIIMKICHNHQGDVYLF